MNSAELRQSFLDFFASKGHTIVRSASLLPTAPNLLFTNAGMNPFVPIFLGEQAPSMAKQLGVITDGMETRAADTQKCIRAGGKHNDLEDVGFDTYHHTCFEMLGNWSFGDYFKAEAIEWAWELLTQVWGLPKERLYATVYKPGEGDPADFDQEAYDYWKAIFEKEGMDPAVHILTSGKKDNFWMMGDTGPCGPCSEVHIDLTPNGDSGGKLVNADSPWCIEIWNLVFMQFAADGEGNYAPLKAKHVDTGMGFERVAGMIATTRDANGNPFKDFSKPQSNYNSDLFTDLFAAITGMCGQQYGYTMPDPEATRESLPQEQMRDIIFRVLADHIRTLCFAIADGILPGNEGRNYVLRRILRRAVMFGKRLELPSGFFARLVEPVVAKFGDTFPEVREKEEIVRKVIASEEASFERTLDRGLRQFESIEQRAKNVAGKRSGYIFSPATEIAGEVRQIGVSDQKADVPMFEIWAVDTFYSEGWLKYSDGFAVIPGAHAFELYDTYGFPLDMTELLARERGLTVDTEGFERCMEEQRARGRASQQTAKITVTEGASQAARTQFAGYTPENLTHFNATVQDIVTQDEVNFVILDETPFYAEMGGQVGDIGVLEVDGVVLPIVDTLKDTAGRYLHKLGEPLPDQLRPDVPAVVTVDTARRTAIQRHHSATHVLNWALREVLGDHVLQRGSYVGPDRLRFDFSHFEAVTAEQLETIERMCNERILENGYVQTFEVPFAEKPPEVIATFGEKYGDVVRVVDIGGFSKELCGGTHVRTAAECGLFKIVSEASISAGVRRIEAVTGEAAYALTKENYERLHRLAGTLKCKPDEIEMRMEKLGEQTKALEKELKALRQQQAAAQAESLLAAAEARDGIKVLAAKVVVAEPGDLKTLANDLCNKLGPSAVALGAIFMDDRVSLCAQCTTEAVTAGYKAGDLVKRMAPIVGGKGGGKPNFAMGGGTEPAKLAAALEAAFSG